MRNYIYTSTCFPEGWYEQGSSNISNTVIGHSMLSSMFLRHWILYLLIERLLVWGLGAFGIEIPTSKYSNFHIRKIPYVGRYQWPRSSIILIRVPVLKNPKTCLLRLKTELHCSTQLTSLMNLKKLGQNL